MSSTTFHRFRLKLVGFCLAQGSVDVPAGTLRIIVGQICITLGFCLTLDRVPFSIWLFEKDCPGLCGDALCAASPLTIPVHCAYSSRSSPVTGFLKSRRPPPHTCVRSAMHSLSQNCVCREIVDSEKDENNVLTRSKRRPRKLLFERKSSFGQCSCRKEIWTVNVCIDVLCAPNAHPGNMKIIICACCVGEVVDDGHCRIAARMFLCWFVSLEMELTERAPALDSSVYTDAPTGKVNIL